jgi:hypothetical protein
MPFVENKTKAKKFIQLPNSDIWLGHRSDEVVRPDTLTALIESPIDVLSSMMKTANGGNMTCPHCGAQFSDKQLNEAREHIEKLHPSAEKPLTNAEVLLAQGGDALDENSEFLGALTLPVIK